MAFFFVKVVFRKEFLAVESSKKNNSGSNIKKSKTIKLDSPISSSKLSKNKNETSGGIFGYSSDEYDLSPATKKRNAVEDYRMYIQKFEDSKVSLKNKNIRQKVSHNNLNLEEKERLGATKVCSLDDFNAAALEENQLIKKYRGADDGGYSDYAKKFVEQSNKIDMSEVESILEAYRELNDKRSPKVREYLKNCSSVGKFGVPQAKWRNGTYGINSKEPDFFHMFRNFR